MFGIFQKSESVDLKDLVAKGAVIVDVRSEEEFGGGHVSGAVNIPLDMLSAGIAKIGGKDTCIITCCKSGGRSTMAKSMLDGAGYSNVHNGGGWQSLQTKLQ